MNEIKAKLEKELRELERELIHELPKEIQTARELGDLRENAEYKAALERQSLVRGRIDQVRQRLEELSRIKLDRIPHDQVHLGSVVKVMDLANDQEITYELVVAEAADAAAGKISIASPIGRGLMGKEEGDEARITTPAGVRHFEILELSTWHQRGESAEGEDS